MQVNILEAKNRLSELIKLVIAGNEVVIANRGEPVVRLVPTQTTQTESSKPGLLQWLEKNPLPPHLQRSHANIELGISEERAAWE